MYRVYGQDLGVGGKEVVEEVIGSFQGRKFND